MTGFKYNKFRLQNELSQALPLLSDLIVKTVSDDSIFCQSNELSGTSWTGHPRHLDAIGTYSSASFACRKTISNEDENAEQMLSDA